MRCPHCGERDTRVVDSRDLDDSATIRRRRECTACTTRFTTYERVEAARLVIVKRDGMRQEFDRDKLATGLRKALTRRPVADDAAEGRRRDRGRAARARARPRCPSSRVGALAMEALRARPDRLHPVRERVPELRGPRGPQARGRHPVRREGQRAALAAVSVLSDRDIRAALEAGTSASTRTTRSTSSRRRSTSTSTASFRVFRNNRYPYIDVRAAAAGPDRAARRSRTTSRSSSTRASSSSARRSNGSSCRTTSSPGSRGRRWPWTRPSRRPTGWRTMGDLEPW